MISRVPDAMEIVVCFDIGSVYTGYAYSSSKEYRSDSLNVHLNEEWMSGHANLHTYKTPSIALLHTDKSFHCYGYEAERKYIQLSESKQQGQWYYFKRFKADLKNKQFRKDTVISEEGEKSMNGIALFTLVLKFLKSHFLESMEDSARYGGVDGIKGYTIKYVLTVPTRWDNASRDCMKTAAKKAGIQSCVILTESEAAGRYCRMLAMRASADSNYYIQLPGTRHVIVNIGGTSVDTALQEIQDDESVTEFSKNVGSTSAGTRVEIDFQKFLSNLFPADFLDFYMKKHKSDYLELLYEFEVKKRKFSLESDVGTKLDLPSSLIKTYEGKYKQSLQFLIDDTDYVGRILSQDDYFIIDKTLMKDIFGPAVKGTVGYLSNLSRDPETKKCDAIILVGGFASSPVVYGAIKFYFPNLSVILADEPDLAVLFGGVLLGHDPGPVIKRKPKYTYGLGMAVPFDSSRHPSQKMFSAGKNQYCSDVFQIHIGLGKVISLGEFCKPRTLAINRARQKRIAIPVYISEKGHPKYTTDEGCSVLGKFYLNLPDTKSGNGKVRVRMALLGQDIIVEAVDERSGFLVQQAFELGPPSQNATK